MLAGLLATTFAWASPGLVRKQVESSLLVKGQIDIEPDGSVSGVAIDREDQLPESVRGFVRESAGRWKFEPVLVDGKAVRARAPMSARLVAKKIEGDSYQVGIRSVNFESHDAGDPSRVESIELNPPRYPVEAFRSGIQGDVYIAVKVGRDGRVMEAVAEQVNLMVFGTEPQMRKSRQILAKGALEEARKWRFRGPTAGARVDDPYWTVRVPVHYRVYDGPVPAAPAYGRWEAYIPGPREPLPWADVADQAGFSPDALVEGGVYTAGIDHVPKLLTPLQGS